jgi:hypothetical protein
MSLRVGPCRLRWQFTQCIFFAPCNKDAGLHPQAETRRNGIHWGHFGPFSFRFMDPQSPGRGSVATRERRWWGIRRQDTYPPELLQ